MRALYRIVTCLGKTVDFVDCELPPGCDDPDSIEALIRAINCSDYDGSEVCDGCYDNRYRAEFDRLLFVPKITVNPEVLAVEGYSEVIGCDGNGAFFASQR